MLSEQLEEAGEYVKELNENMTAYRRFTKENIPEFFDKEREREPPNDFNDSSFLYIRSYDADIGVRPFSNIVFWNSPDITVAPLTDTAAYTNTLEAGLSYQFSCTIRNRGDLIVPSANVEFFLVNPSLGFDTRFAKKLGITSCWVNSQGVNKAAIQYTIPGSESGHKCLFARTYTFSPLDVPVDDYQLSPPLDRHVAQLNLNILAQSSASAYSFNLVHLPKARERIVFMPMTQNQVMALCHPFLADFKIVKCAATDLLKKIEIKPVSKNENIKIKKEGAEFMLTMKGEEGMDINQQAEMMKAITNALQAINAGKAKPAQFMELFGAFREMNKPMQNTTFKIQIPNFRLQKGEALGLQIVNTNMINRETKGGITLIVTGKRRKS
jgi:hypothetical protein